MGRNRSNLSEGATKTKQRSDGQGRGVSWGRIKYERRLGRPIMKIGRSRFYLLKKNLPPGASRCKQRAVGQSPDVGR